MVDSDYNGIKHVCGMSKSIPISKMPARGRLKARRSRV